MLRIRNLRNLASLNKTVSRIYYECVMIMSHFTKESWVYDLTFGNSVVIKTARMAFLHSVL